MLERERAAAEEMLKELDERRRQILTLRYSLDGHAQPRSLEEVATALGCSPEEVRQEEQAAFVEIRRRLSE